MTRRDYVLISKALASTRPGLHHQTYQTWRVTVYAVANAIAQGEPGFDLARFIAACLEGDRA